MPRIFSLLLTVTTLALVAWTAGAADDAKKPKDIPWPPTLPGEVDGAVTLTSPDFLEVPEVVQQKSQEPGAAPFVVAKKPPTVSLYFHQNLGPNASTRTMWTTWGDICLASDGRVYCGIGDHHHEGEGDARCFIYSYDPTKKKLEQVVDMNQHIPPKPGRTSWSKVHAKIDEAADGKIYFSCTMNDGAKAGDPTYTKWDDALPGGQLYQYDPKTGKTVTFVTLPTPPRCTATSLLDLKRNIWWCNLEAGQGNALWGVDLGTKKTVFQSPDGTIGFNRAMALANDGSVYFNGVSDLQARVQKAIQENTAKAAAEDEKPPTDPKEAKAAAKAKARAKAEAKAKLVAARADAKENQRAKLMKYDATKKQVVETKTVFTGMPGIRCATRETADGYIYGITDGPHQLFSYSVKDDKFTLLGPSFFKGEYTVVIDISPDDRYLYYLPGAHGQAHTFGTPVIQYEIATGTRKVLAFLAPAFKKAHEYLPSGTYGVKVSADGGTLYVNFNGDPTERFLADKMKVDGFGMTSFAVIQIPASERSK